MKSSAVNAAALLSLPTLSGLPTPPIASIRRAARIGLVALAMLPMAGAATALDGIDLSRGILQREAAVPGAETTGCPMLIEIKYPFLRCPDGQIGLAEGDDTWENSRQIPRQGEWNEGHGAWGPGPDRD